VAQGFPVALLSESFRQFIQAQNALRNGQAEIKHLLMDNPVLQWRFIRFRLPQGYYRVRRISRDTGNRRVWWVKAGCFQWNEGGLSRSCWGCFIRNCSARRPEGIY